MLVINGLLTFKFGELHSLGQVGSAESLCISYGCMDTSVLY